MTKLDKLKKRLLGLPPNFTWDELESLLSKLGFSVKGREGSNRAFIREIDNKKILLHKPHPGNIVKKYALKLVVKELWGELKKDEGDDHEQPDI